jgi:biopolymer transport protein ExbD
MIRMLVATIVCSTASVVYAADMPKPPEAAKPTKPIVLRVAMTVAADGELLISLDGKPVPAPADKKRTRFDELTTRIRKATETPPGGDPKRFEVELDAADEVKYEHIVSAIQAVSSCLDDDGKPRPLVPKVKFKGKDGAGTEPGLESKLPKMP